MASNINDSKMSTNQSLLQKTGKTQAAFVPKLFIMVKDMKQPTVEDPNTERPLISWSKAGDVFCVFDPIEFSRVILPLHFKHNNWQSFVRQLNMYGFHKVNDLLSSHCNTDSAQAWEFRHPHFKRDRPDLLPLIKRKSTKHHGSSKAASAQVKALPSARTGETRFHHQIPKLDGISRRNSRSFQAYAPHNHRPSVLPLAHRPLQGNPPPPLHLSKVNVLPHLSARLPVLHPLLTHPMQYPQTSPQKIKPFSLPALKPADIKGLSSTATTNTRKSPVMQPSPPSAQPPAHNLPSTISQRTQPTTHHVQENQCNQRNCVDAWRSKPETHRSYTALRRVEDELRKLNSQLSHRDVVGNDMFSVLGLLVELVSLLVNNQVEKSPPDQQKILFNYVQATHEAMAKLGSFSHACRQAAKKSSGPSLSDSISPVSTDPTERLSFPPHPVHRTPVDSNFPKSDDGFIIPSRVARPRYPDHLSSSQSLPPLKTMMAKCPPPVLNRTCSSGQLPASINRLMNDDRLENSTAETSPASDDENFADEPEHLIRDDQSELIQDHDDLSQSDADKDDYEDLMQDDEPEDDREEDNNNALQENDKSHEEDGSLKDDSEHEEVQSADGQKSASYHPSDTSASLKDNFAPKIASEFQRDLKKYRSDLLPTKRPGAQLLSILWSANEPSTQPTPEGIDASRKRIKVD